MAIEIRELVVRGTVGTGGERLRPGVEGSPWGCCHPVADPAPESSEPRDDLLAYVLERLREQKER